MKYFIIIASIILFSTCKTTQSELKQDEDLAFIEENAITQNAIRLEYSAITRGSFLEIRIQKHKILVKEEQYGPDKIGDLSDVQWDILMNKVHAVDLNVVTTLEAPSMKRAHDGAATAKLNIIKGDKHYITPEFDHGNPNVEIEPLVTYMLSLAKKVE